MKNLIQMRVDNKVFTVTPGAQKEINGILAGFQSAVVEEVMMALPRAVDNGQAILDLLSDKKQISKKDIAAIKELLTSDE